MPAKSGTEEDNQFKKKRANCSTGQGISEQANSSVREEQMRMQLAA